MSLEKTFTQKWTHPDEFIKLQRLKQKKRQLAARIKNKKFIHPVIDETDKVKLLEAKLAHKRKNPFTKNQDSGKRHKSNEQLPLDDDTLLNFICSKSTTTCSQDSIFVRETPTRPPPAKLVLQPFDPKKFAQLLERSSNATVDDPEGPDQQVHTKHLPIDWCLKSRARIFCETDLPATILKTSQIASSLTGFVRCIDTKNAESRLDISSATRFNQTTYYWQHPHIPWLTLFPRNSKENTGVSIGERERKALAEEWDYSFRGLFQLLRARQCPYFYVCANTFTVLFRAAGVGGRVEVHALLTPSTRGMRQALRQEGVEFTMPLKSDFHPTKSAENSLNEDDSNERVNGIGIKETTEKENNENDVSDDDDEKWLESLGVDEHEIRKIKTAHARKVSTAEMADDFSDSSLLLIEGVECQGFFSYLLNAKSTITSVGRLAGVPPTLLAPVAFPKATLQHLATRSSKVRLDGIDYCSIDVKGILLPTFLPHICQLLSETKEMFSVRLASHSNTLAITKASHKLIEFSNLSSEATTAQDGDMAAGQVFGQENLSDCGLLTEIIESICSTEQNAVALLERVCYNKNEGYAWS